MISDIATYIKTLNSNFNAYRTNRRKLWKKKKHEKELFSTLNNMPIKPDLDAWTITDLSSTLNDCLAEQEDVIRTVTLVQSKKMLDIYPHIAGKFAENVCVLLIDTKNDADDDVADKTNEMARQIFDILSQRGDWDSCCKTMGLKEALEEADLARGERDSVPGPAPEGTLQRPISQIMTI